MKNYLSILLVLFCFNASFLNGQDIHHSQFYNSPLNLSPGLTGVFNGDQRVTINFRRQWFIDNIVRYMTVTGSFDMKFIPKKWKTKGHFNGGLIFNYDQAGDSKMGLAHLGLNISYTYPLNTNNIITLGGLIGLSQRRFNPDELQWDAQYVNDIFDPTLPSGENLAKTSNNFMDVSAGINYRWQKSKRTKIDFGVAAFHLNGPNQQFFGQSLAIKLPIRLNLNITPNFQITKYIDLLLHAQYQNQKPFEETVFGAYVKFHLNTQRGKELKFLLGVSDRINDAIIPKIAVEWTDWYVGVSYDINNSGFDRYTLQRGGPEFSLIHILTKSHPLKLLKSCPIF